MIYFLHLPHNVSFAKQKSYRDQDVNTLFQVSLFGARLQIFPDSPFGANNHALFE